MYWSSVMFCHSQFVVKETMASTAEFLHHVLLFPCTPSLTFPAGRAHLQQKASWCNVHVRTSTVKINWPNWLQTSPEHLLFSCIKMTIKMGSLCPQAPGRKIGKSWWINDLEIYIFLLAVITPATHAHIKLGFISSLSFIPLVARLLFAPVVNNSGSAHFWVKFLDIYLPLFLCLTNPVFLCVTGSLQPVSLPMWHCPSKFLLKKLNIAHKGSKLHSRANKRRWFKGKITVPLTLSSNTEPTHFNHSCQNETVWKIDEQTFVWGYFSSLLSDTIGLIFINTNLTLTHSRMQWNQVRAVISYVGDNDSISPEDYCLCWSERVAGRLSSQRRFHFTATHFCLVCRTQNVWLPITNEKTGEMTINVGFWFKNLISWHGKGRFECMSGAYVSRPQVMENILRFILFIQLFYSEGTSLIS